MQQRPSLPQPHKTQRKPRKKYIRIIGIVVAFVAIGVMYVYGVRLVDAVLASRYVPDARMSEIMNRLDLTDHALAIYKASNPAIQERDEFNRTCNTNERTSAILGCYYRRQIYLYNIQHKDLDGAQEVTASHEMLHAAYERLPFFERKRIDRLLEEQYDSLRDDHALQRIMEYYKSAEPNDLTNELHSIIGTTIDEISPELEEYYARYFANRRSVVAMHAQYNIVFKSLEQDASRLSTKLATMESEIKTLLSVYDSDREQLERDIASFNSRVDGGQIRYGQYTNERAIINNRAAELNTRRDTINARIDEYNTDVSTLNALSVRADELNRSINGISEPTGVK